MSPPLRGWFVVDLCHCRKPNVVLTHTPNQTEERQYLTQLKLRLFKPAIDAFRRNPLQFSRIEVSLSFRSQIHG